MKVSALQPLALLAALSPALARLGSNEDEPTSDSKRLLQNKESPADSYRIVNGENAGSDEFEWFVSWEGCGASLIHEDIILSAAHCDAITSNDVYVGAYNKGWWPFGRGEKRRVVERRVHPQFDDFTLANDVMVLKISTPSTRPVIQLNDDPDSPQVGEDLVAIGHGITETGRPATQLRKVTVPHIAHDQCAADYRFFKTVVEDRMLCAGFEQGGRDTCTGDSGGPLLKQVGNTFTQVGVTSWGDGCAQPNAPGVYARVSGLKDWIDAQICELSSKPPAGCPLNVVPIGKVAVRIDINFDYYPRETGWTIEQNGVVIESRQQGTYTQQGIVSERLYLDPGTYVFTITDKLGDGICCAFGNGYYRIYAEFGNVDQILVAGDGNFGFSQTEMLEISGIAISRTPPTPAPTTEPVPSPTPAPVSPTVTSPGVTPSPTDDIDYVCQDSFDLFLVNANVGMKDCFWLADNLDEFWYLCLFVDVALTCPDTCSMCSLVP